jgi:hypothetical protein
LADARLADAAFPDARLGDAPFPDVLLAFGRFAVARGEDPVFADDAGFGPRPPPTRKAPLAGV